MKFSSEKDVSVQEIVVVSGADERYALPLAVTIRSALDQLEPWQRMRLFILDGGIEEETRIRLIRSWQSPLVSVTWLEPRIDLVQDLPVSDHISVAAYLRLMLPDLLPPDVTKLIYLDADMLVMKNLVSLWNEPHGESTVLAVQDYAAPFIDSSVSLKNFPACNPYLAAAFPIRNYRELGIPEDGKYFNSGLLFIDMERWRAERITENVFACLHDNREHVLWWDQYALNVVLVGKWRCLDQRWNQGAHLFHYPHWRESPFDKATFSQLQSDPWIVHFCSPSKPWQYFCSHPHARDFRAYLQQTEWKDYRPSRPDAFVSKWWEFRYRQVKKKLRNTLGSVGRRAA